MNFYETVTAAIADLTLHGYDSQARVDRWVLALRTAAEQHLTPEHVLTEGLRAALTTAYRRAVESPAPLRLHAGVSRFTIDRLKPKMQAELNRRIQLSANLIKLNRQKQIETTLQRFSGWASSVPPGGSKVVDKRDESAHIRKALKSLPFEERRVAIDQSHKLTHSINKIIAEENGAIAAEWRSQWRQPGYNYREDHKERDGKVWAIRGNWALEKGLMKPGPDGYTDDITEPNEEPFCFPGDSVVPFADRVSKAYRRWYDGELSIITTNSGKTIRATPNHPVLTPKGWVPIGALNEGDHVIEVSDEGIAAFEEHQKHAGVATISDVFGALDKSGVVHTLDGRRTNFHGDGSDGYVNVVFSARGLSIGRQAADDKAVEQLDFANPFSFTAGLRRFDKGAQFPGPSAQTVVGGLGAQFPALGLVCGHADTVGVRLISGGDVVGFQAAHYDGSGYPKSVRYGEHRLAICETANDVAIVSDSSGDDAVEFLEDDAFFFDPIEKGGHLHPDHRGYLGHSVPFGTQAVEVVKVERERFSGHVYNLQTISGWYVVNGIITHNCRCSYRYVYTLRSLPDTMLTVKGLAAINRG